MMRLLIGIFIMLLAWSISGCSSRESSPDTLAVSRSNPLSQPAVPSLNTTITDANQVAELYNKIIRLPKFPPGKIHCPNDNGISYHLVFRRQDTVVLTADAQASGCQAVATQQGSYWSMEPKGKTGYDLHWLTCWE